MMEETNLKIEPTDILGVYFAPHRDPRGHIVTVVFVGRIIDGQDMELLTCQAIPKKLLERCRLCN